ncbi:hypothetical protein NHJ13051_004443 [Beauveria bassiana]
MPNTPAGPAAHLYAAIAATIQVPPPSAPSCGRWRKHPYAASQPLARRLLPYTAHHSPTSTRPDTIPVLPSVRRLLLFSPQKASFVWPCLSATRPTRRRSALRFLFFSTFNSNHERLVSCSVWFPLPSRAIHRF